ncbi:hypothetical protein L3X38_017494 [Prunus dulcis]|uniref:Uncharacterized protein n=1 Tax=Prunus dulcis TaxID=3755 RepID=A0AAD4W7E1_PRUDU|nr:hypothetical protein L3X38_017494 [Prunus dulcis]
MEVASEQLHCKGVPQAGGGLGPKGSAQDPVLGPTRSGKPIGRSGPSYCLRANDINADTSALRQCCKKPTATSNMTSPRGSDPKISSNPTAGHFFS